jgi:hypothetical protein
VVAVALAKEHMLVAMEVQVLQSFVILALKLQPVEQLPQLLDTLYIPLRVMEHLQLIPHHLITTPSIKLNNKDT